MSHEAYIIRSSRIVAENRIAPGSILIRGDKVERIELASEDGRTPASPIPGTYPELDAGDLVVMPGLVDTHVHVNEPGRTDWEGFVTAGRAAAAGGITTIVVMPLNCSPAATSVAALMGEAEAAAGKCLVDYGFWGGLVPGNQHELEPMWNAGALGFKAFMVDSGIDDFGGASEQDLELAAPILARLDVPLLVHAEDAKVIARASRPSPIKRVATSYKDYLATRPLEAEDRAVQALISLSERFGIRIHVVHITSMSPQMFLAAHKRPALRISGETCPHYLVFAAEEIPDGATDNKCAPPIRERIHREQLWRLLGRENGLLDMIVSDHSPCPPHMKCLESGDFQRAWGGISSLQLGLSAVWTAANASAGGLNTFLDRSGEPHRGLCDISRLMSEAPSALAGLSTRKGRIAPGYDADLVFFDPDAHWVVRPATLHHRHKLTPYDGMPLRGVVKRTILRGRTIYDAALANPFPLDPIGQWIKRGTT